MVLFRHVFNSPRKCCVNVISKHNFKKTLYLRVHTFSISQEVATIIAINVDINHRPFYMRRRFSFYIGKFVYYLVHRYYERLKNRV